ncbi:MAG: phosphonopyruvate decarboxylase [Candidatus Lokiarchaeota archaeon]|nr:phosphonopyruvate decarboxylase [Candidatus Lokiarchaeota archaeon]
MISCRDFINTLNKYEFTFFTGIPDSTFKEFMKFLSENKSINLNNIIACNECEAIALATGYHLSTNKIGIVYLQNSGLGKAVNPITSLCDPEVYSIPILLMIGWRGEPGKNDAPQHKKMGMVTLPLLDTLQIPYVILDPSLESIDRELIKAKSYLTKHKGPYAFVFRRNFFEEYKINKDSSNNYSLTTTDVINLIMENLDNTEVIISTTGYISRILYGYRVSRMLDHNKSFYNVGSMGCASSIGLGIALQKPNRRIIIFDGDGAVIMQMGAFTTIGKNSPSNFVHVIFDNEAHESTGGQPTNSPKIDFSAIAKACNYKSVFLIQSRKELLNCMDYIKNGKGPILIHIKINLSQNKDLKRPEKLLKEYREEFMQNLIK